MDTNYKRAEALKFLCLGLSYVFSFAYVNIFFIARSTSMLGITIYITFLSLGAVLWLELTMMQQRLKGVQKTGSLQKIEPRFWEVILVLLCLNTYFGQTVILTFFLIHLVVIYMVLTGTSHLLSDRSSCLMPLDLFNGMVVMPLRNCLARLWSVTETIDHKNAAVESAVSPSTNSDTETQAPATKRFSVGKCFGILGVLLLIFLIFDIALSTLARVDARFERVLNSIDDLLSSISIPLQFFKFILSVPVGIYLFALFQGGVRTDTSVEKNFHNELVDKSKKCRIMPTVLLSIVLVVFILVYLAFYVSQAAYMFSGFAGVLPAQFTASEYAVQGFYELIEVVIINFVLLSVIRIFSAATRPIVTKLSVVLMAESMIFAAISASKIILYMSRFGYTESRTLGLWGTIVVFAGAALCIVNLLTKRRTFAPWLFFSASAYVVMNFIAYNYI